MKNNITSILAVFMINTLVTGTHLTYAGETELNGHELLDKCQVAVDYLDNDLKSDDLESVRFCDDYLMGFREDENVKQRYLPGQYFKGYCFPTNGVNNGELARVVVDYLQVTDDGLDKSARELVRQALIHGYPCAN